MSTLLLDLGNGKALRGLLVLSVVSALLVLLPVLEVVVSRFLTSSLLWMKWQSWGRFVHAALPLKILIGQMAWKFLAGSFGKLEGWIRDYIVELECAILEEGIPVTIRDEMEDEGDDSSFSASSDDDDDDDDFDANEDDDESEYDEYDDDY